MIFSLYKFQYSTAKSIWGIRTSSVGNMCIAQKFWKYKRFCLTKKFNIQQLYALPTLYLCVLYLSENKQRLVPLTS